MKWVVELTIGGRKFRSRVEAPNAETAKYVVLGKIKFTSCEPDKEMGDNDVIDFFNGILNGKMR